MCNADGCTRSAKSLWPGVTLPPPVWVATPPPAVPTRANLTSVARAPTPSALIVLGVRVADGAGGARVGGLELKRPLVAGEGGVVLRHAYPTALNWGVATAVCGGGRSLSSVTLRSRDVRVGGPRPTPPPTPPPTSTRAPTPTPTQTPSHGSSGSCSGGQGDGAAALMRVCPPFVAAIAADYHGYVLNKGAVFRTPTCAACRAACACTPGCDTWVYGADAADGGRHRQCWLKKAFPGAQPVVKPPPADGGGSPWVSGVVARPRRCSGFFSAN